MFFSLLAQGPQPTGWGSIPGFPANRCLNTAFGFEVATIQGFECIFYNVVTVVTALAAIAVFVILVSGGFKYLTSGGDQKALEQAKGTITYGILGLVLIIAAYLILNFLSAFTGIPGLTQFKIPGL